MLIHNQFQGTLLSEWMEFYLQKQERKGRRDGKIIRYTRKLIRWYSDIPLDKLSLQYCLGFIDYLLNEYKTSASKLLAKVTARNYYRCLNTALNDAVRDGVIIENPCNHVNHTDKIKVSETTRCYLSVEEVNLLIHTKCKRDDVKSAYLFACFCGLRISDISSLRWNEIEVNGDSIYVNKIMHKTGVCLYLPLSKEAQRWLPKPINSDNKVYHLPSQNYINRILKEWSLSAGITKHITFHTARHTFATMMLTLGADLYTTSKLLGHTSIATTQIYARIINKKKEEAVNLVDGLF